MNIYLCLSRRTCPDPVDGSRVEHCQKCAQDIWVAQSEKLLRASNMVTVCEECFIKLGATGKLPEKMKVVNPVPTTEQLAEIIKSGMH